MTLLIKIEGGNCTFALVDGRKVLDTEVFAFDRSLAEVLIVKLDKLFVRSRLSRLSLKSVKLVGKIDKNTTNYKLLQAFMKGLES